MNTQIQPKIVISSFCQERDQSSCAFPLEHTLRDIQANFHRQKPGYRNGVIIVPIPVTGFTGKLVILEDGDKLIGEFKPRHPGETPRKHIHAEKPVSPVKFVDVVLYHRDVLAEKKENSDLSADYEVITFITKVSDEDQPMPPDTLMANHFQDSGGTATEFSNDKFVEELRRSYEFWKNKVTTP